jgi:hypothetical protein
MQSKLRSILKESVMTKHFALFTHQFELKEFFTVAESLTLRVSSQTDAFEFYFALFRVP